MDRDRIIMTKDGRERILVAAETPEELKSENAAKQEQTAQNMQAAVNVVHNPLTENYTRLLNGLKWVASASEEELDQVGPDAYKLTALQKAIANIYGKDWGKNAR